MAQPVSITTPTTFAPSPSNKDSFHSTTPSISSSSPSPSSSAETVKKDHMKLPNKDLKNKDIITMDNNNHHLGESFKHLTTNVRLKEAIDQILTDSTPEQISYENKELLINNVELAMSSAKEDVYSNPTAVAAGMTVDEIAAIKMYTMAADPPSSSL
eukprot:gene41238-54636_t